VPRRPSALAELWARHLAAPRPRAWLGPFGGRHLRACRPVERLELRGSPAQPRLWWWREGRLRRPDLPPLELLEERVRARGLAATGFLAYEFVHLLQELPVHPAPPGPWPLFQFTLFAEEEELADAAALGDWPSPAPGAAALGGPLRAEASPEVFRRGVRRIREWIRAGDCYQVNLVQAFHGRWPLAEAPRLFAALRAGQPAEGYRALLEERGRALLSDSPELFLERRGERLRTQPIKGTAPRGADWRAAARTLRESAKDRAELAMIVDLLRNDLSRVCRPGSVRVGPWPQWLVLPQLVHSAATVQGRLRHGADLGAILAATFPGGSVTGCPRTRAMERITQLEPAPRGPCFGAVGRLEADGDFLFNVAIRTALLRQGELRLLAGGGITLDSTPAAEEAESRLKAERFRRLLEPGPLPRQN